TSGGSGLERLTRGLEALCDLLERHLPLMLATDEAFHQDTAPGVPADYLHPFIQFLGEGAQDGSLSETGDVVRTADIAFNMVASPRGSSGRCCRSAMSRGFTSTAGATEARTSTSGSSPGRLGCSRRRGWRFRSGRTCFRTSPTRSSPPRRSASRPPCDGAPDR